MSKDIVKDLPIEMLSKSIDSLEVALLLLISQLRGKQKVNLATGDIVIGYPIPEKMLDNLEKIITKAKFNN